jgi:methylenetetrahydrofolate reductase (NADPH)
MTPSLSSAVRVAAEEDAMRVMPISADRRAAAGRLLTGYSIEITGADKAVAEVCEADLPAWTEVFIAFVPGESPARVIDAARKVARRGLTPVPHLVARAMTGVDMLDDLLARFAGEAGVRSALVIAGDRPKADGPYHASVELVATGLFEKHGFEKLSFALHPEGHPKVADAVIRDAVSVKLAEVRARGIEPRLVSQFALHAEPVIERVRILPAEAPGAPVRIGVAGPTSRKTLWKYALYCGIGNSLKALSSHGETFGHLMLSADPEALVAEVAEGLAALPEPRPAIEGLHIFTFGGVAKSVEWANQLVAEARRANP